MNVCNTRHLFDRRPPEVVDLFFLISSSNVGFLPGPNILPLRGKVRRVVPDLSVELKGFLSECDDVDVDAADALLVAAMVEAEGLDGKDGWAGRVDGFDSDCSN